VAVSQATQARKVHDAYFFSWLNAAAFRHELGQHHVAADRQAQVAERDRAMGFSA